VRFEGLLGAEAPVRLEDWFAAVRAVDGLAAGAAVREDWFAAVRLGDWFAAEAAVRREDGLAADAAVRLDGLPAEAVVRLDGELVAEAVRLDGLAAADPTVVRGAGWPPFAPTARLDADSLGVELSGELGRRDLGPRIRTVSSSSAALGPDVPFWSASVAGTTVKTAGDSSLRSITRMPRTGVSTSCVSS
jgi:hypothetical protein